MLNDTPIRVYEDTYREMREKNHTKIPFPEFMRRMIRRNEEIRKKEFEERRIVLS